MSTVISKINIRKGKSTSRCFNLDNSWTLAVLLCPQGTQSGNCCACACPCSCSNFRHYLQNAILGENEPLLGNSSVFLFSVIFVLNAQISARTFRTRSSRLFTCLPRFASSSLSFLPSLSQKSHMLSIFFYNKSKIF